ncbi:hypothetical protein [Paractinoplanes durhamensis]|uniref:hypothetical protein n=1 Tax=Paractinoplanes durhamensis TaxID=113563 RepID=UPI00362582FE
MQRRSAHLVGAALAGKRRQHHRNDRGRRQSQRCRRRQRCGRRAKLHAAAQCIREHGVPNYQDPVLTADGYVYTDEVAFRPIEGPQMEAIQTTCHDLIQAAGFAIRDQGPPPPKLIQAGVKSAQCMRAHGLPNFKDPTADSRFAPGKGFGMDPTSIPPGGKQNPTLRRAAEACQAVLDEEAAASSLGNLGNA